MPVSTTTPTRRRPSPLFHASRLDEGVDLTALCQALPGPATATVLAQLAGMPAPVPHEPEPTDQTSPAAGADAGPVTPLS